VRTRRAYIESVNSVTTEERRKRDRGDVPPDRRKRVKNIGNLPPDARDRLKKAMRQLMTRYPPDVAQSAAARDLGYSPAAINRLLRGFGGSVRMVTAISRALNIREEAILFGEDGEKPQRRLRDLPLFEEALADAKRRAPLEHPNVPLHLLEKAGDALIIPEPFVVTATLLITVVTVTQRPQDDGAESVVVKRRPRRDT